MRLPEYDRAMRHSTLVEGAGFARDALHDVIQSISALSFMTRCMLAGDTEEISPTIANGVERLFDQQCAMLNGIFAELGEEENKRKDERAEVGDFDQRSAPLEALLEPARKLRLQFIQASAQAGAAHSDIARALNVDEADIARVVSQLRGEAKTMTARAAKRA